MWCGGMMDVDVVVWMWWCGCGGVDVVVWMWWCGLMIWFDDVV
jgi:hypothetical protein